MTVAVDLGRKATKQTKQDILYVKILSITYRYFSVFSTQVGFMRNGRILAEDTPDNIMEKFKMQVSHQYYYHMSY